MTLLVNQNNIQGLLFQPYLYPLSRHFLFRFERAAAGRAFIARWVDAITHGPVDLAARPEPLLNIALTWSGLLALDAFEGMPGGASRAADLFPWDFSEPPDDHSLGDYGESAPSHWWSGRFASDTVHVALHAFFVTGDAQDRFTGELRAFAERLGVKELIPTADGKDPISGQTLNPTNVRELHFGYQDGFSQPQINWHNAPGQPHHTDPRHYLLGYWSEEIESFPKDSPWSDFVRDGSYMAFRWLYQDVAAFEAYLDAQAATVQEPGMSVEDARELLAAKMMGRWRDGTPLALSSRPNPALAANTFGYAHDPNGHQCPFAAHIRIVNPRDQPLTHPNAVMFPNGPPRVLRRGHTYGPRLPAGASDDGVDRGIIGLFLCSNLNRQFYALTRWMRQTSFSPVFQDTRSQDPLFGNRSVPMASHSFEIPKGAASVKVHGLPDFVRTKGTLMLLLPSMRMLRQLSVAS